MIDDFSLTVTLTGDSMKPYTTLGGYLNILRALRIINPEELIKFYSSKWYPYNWTK